MVELALVAATLAALAVIVLAVRILFLVRRVQKVWERVDHTIRSDLSPGICAWRDAARGVQQAAAKLEGGLAGIERIIHRLDGLSERLDSGLLMGLALTKLSSWLAGVRRGLRVHQQRVPARHAPEPGESEGEPGD